MVFASARRSRLTCCLSSFKLYFGENASATTIWWPFSGNTDAFDFKPVAIQLCSQNLLPFVLNGYSFTCAATILRPFLFVVTLRFFKAAHAAVPPPARGCSINAYKTLYLLQYIIVFSASKDQKPGEACGVLQGLGVGPGAAQWSNLVTAVKQWSNLTRSRVPF